MRITKEHILRDYQKLKKKVISSLKSQKLELACSFMSNAALLMYNSNLLYEDVDLENSLKNIAQVLLPKPNYHFDNNKRIVFYDYFVLDNRGLTEQYLNALFDSEYELLFVGCQQGKQSEQIYQKLNDHNVKIISVSEKEETKKAKVIHKIIEDFAPSIIISHTSPWDIAGLMAICSFEGCCTRYLINITDHAFWLGTTIFDYYFEFRDYGFNISTRYRNIEASKLLKLPYYPIINKNIPFEGFDFDTRNKKLIFSGGNLYKIQGSPVFLDLVKYILTTYSDTIFLFLGNGDSSYIQEFIDKNDFHNRLFYRNERKDIWEVFKHCNLYLNTYPLIGGLMTQYACVAGVVPITLNDTNDKCNDIYELMQNHFDLDFQFDSIDKCKAKIDEYLQTPEKMILEGEKLRDAIIKPESFKELLVNYLKQPSNRLDINKYDIDVNLFSEQYLNRFNENNGIHYYSCFCKKNIKYLLNFPLYYARYILLRFLARLRLVSFK